MSDKGTHSYYVEDRYDEWLENLPQNKSEVVNSLLEAAYEGEGGGTLSLEDVMAEQLRTEAEGLRSEAEAKEALAEKYESRSQKRAEATPGYEERLHSLLETIADKGTHLWPENENIQEIATQQHTTPEAVLERAKQIAVDMDTTVYNTQFVRAAEAKRMQKKPISEVEE